MLSMSANNIVVPIVKDESILIGGSPVKVVSNGHCSPDGMAGKKEPDADAIKMFCGQIPRHMDENDLRKMFEEFGPVYQLNVLRDKATGQSKGCCFVMFYARKAAIEAQNALHNIKTLPGMHHPVQMKPADCENRNERKLFVGMINKKYGEAEVRQMFSHLGLIEDCTVLRDANGTSKGCAFVTFSSRTCAMNAIKQMHHTLTMEGCAMPLVVKFADTQKEKEQKKTTPQITYVGVAGSSPTASQPIPTLTNNTPINSPYLAMLQQAQQQQSAQTNALGGLNLQQLLLLAAAAQAGHTNGAGLGAFGLGGYAQPVSSGQESSFNLQYNKVTISAPSNNQTGLGGLAALASALLGSPNGSQTAGAGLNSFALQNLASLTNGNAYATPSTSSGVSNVDGLQSAAPPPGYSSLTANSPATPYFRRALNTGSFTSAANSPLSGISSLTGAPISMSALCPSSNNSLGGLDALSQAYSGIQQYAAAFPSAFCQAGLSLGQQQTQISSNSKQNSEGPEGANLFIYHLPQEFTDSDLAQTFQPFGTVLSAKVFVDKQTNLSKCFGFVSYESPAQAAAAIQAMNGFQIGTKRLKVQLKRSKHDAKPYQHPN